MGVVACGRRVRAGTGILRALCTAYATPATPALPVLLAAALHHAGRLPVTTAWATPT